ncbi:MAG: hypothetical protein M0Q91_15860 [Methanoregula sp.]|nr:hypothetical protein [Methanoregula sp.]
MSSGLWSRLVICGRSVCAMGVFRKWKNKENPYGKMYPTINKQINLLIGNSSRFGKEQLFFRLLLRKSE